MRKKTAALVLAAGLVTGGGAALVGPGIALAADSTTSTTGTTDRVASRLSAITDALKGLVSDGTITQQQADKVATTLSTADLGGGGHGPRAGRVTPEATAKVLGITVDELRTAQQDGQTLAQIAEAHDVSRTDLVNGLVDAAKAQLAADVKAGTITQAQSDQLSADLTARITERIDQVGRGGHGGPHGGADDSTGSGTDSGTTATPSPSTTS